MEVEGDVKRNFGLWWEWRNCFQRGVEVVYGVRGGVQNHKGRKCTGGENHFLDPSPHR